jgi:biopolymer transport protein ExbB/TolQ
MTLLSAVAPGVAMRLVQAIAALVAAIAAMNVIRGLLNIWVYVAMMSYYAKLANLDIITKLPVFPGIYMACVF